MSAQPVDVLAVLDLAQRALNGGPDTLTGMEHAQAHAGMIEARAAVAQLIAERDRYEKALYLIANGDQRPGHVDAITKARMAELARAALARVQPTT